MIMVAGSALLLGTSMRRIKRCNYFSSITETRLTRSSRRITLIQDNKRKKVFNLPQNQLNFRVD